MILKSFEFKKINIKKYNFYLFYGENDGLKKEIIDTNFKKIFKENNYNYEENIILQNQKNFFDEILTKSFFETEKLIIISDASNKIIEIIEELIEKKIQDVYIIFLADKLDKKSKLRSFFEKEKNCICVPFYPDNEQTLSKLAYNFFREKKILLSSADINIIINKSAGDRENLFNELKKVEFYVANGKKISSEKLSKLINLIENHSISELINNCLIENKKKTISILNENNFGSDDCILIIRTFLNKSKRILKLLHEYEFNKDINLTISSYKPPIFWKDKEIIKQQMQKWNSKNLKNLIYKMSEIELLIKKNINNSLNLTTNFLLENSSSITNN